MLHSVRCTYCDGRIYSLGMCEKHYRRYRRTGSALIVRRPGPKCVTSVGDIQYLLKFYTVKQISERLHLHRSTIYRYLNGKIRDA